MAVMPPGGFRDFPFEIGGGPGAASDVGDPAPAPTQARTTEDALRAAGVPEAAVSTRVVSAHSGGGAALASAIGAAADGSRLRCDQLELQDCLYGSEASIAAWPRPRTAAPSGASSTSGGRMSPAARAGFRPPSARASPTPSTPGA